MQISLNLNLIINEVSDSQTASPHQKLADTSVRSQPGVCWSSRQAPPASGPGHSRHAGGRGAREDVGVPTAGAQTLACFYAQARAFTQAPRDIKTLVQSPTAGPAPGDPTGLWPELVSLPGGHRQGQVGGGPAPHSCPVPCSSLNKFWREDASQQLWGTYWMPSTLQDSLIHTNSFHSCRTAPRGRCQDDPGHTDTQTEQPGQPQAVSRACPCHTQRGVGPARGQLSRAAQSWARAEGRTRALKLTSLKSNNSNSDASPWPRPSQVTDDTRAPELRPPPTSAMSKVRRKSQISAQTRKP